MRYFNYFVFSNSNHTTVILGVVQLLMVIQNNCLYYNDVIIPEVSVAPQLKYLFAQFTMIII